MYFPRVLHFIIATIKTSKLKIIALYGTLKTSHDAINACMNIIVTRFIFEGQLKNMSILFA
jgi:hypothetical protein